MPKNAPTIKCRAVEAYGGKITFCEPKVSARNEAGARIQAETGAVMIHPYDDDQSSWVKRLPRWNAARGRQLDTMAPVSGGGLLRDD
jgi:hypothetical protein